VEAPVDEGLPPLEMRAGRVDQLAEACLRDWGPKGARGSACFALGEFHQVGFGVPQDVWASYRLKERGCDVHGHGACCHDVARFKWGGLRRRTRVDPAKIDPEAPEEVAAVARELNGVEEVGGTPEARVEAMGELRRACRRGYARSCGLLAEFQLRGEPGSGERSEALPLLEKACKGEAQEACTALGLHHLQGAREARQREADAAAAATSGAGGEGGGSNKDEGRWSPKVSWDAVRDPVRWMREAKEGGEGSEVKARRAARYLSEACSLGHDDGCSLLGQLHLEGQGVPKSVNAGMSLMLLGGQPELMAGAVEDCEASGGDPESDACARLEKVLVIESQRNVQRGNPVAVESYRAACARTRTRPTSFPCAVLDQYEDTPNVKLHNYPG